MAGVYDTCAECRAPMSHPQGRGKARKYCCAACQQSAASARTARRPKHACSVVGCADEATRLGRSLCEAHYMRIRRHGDTSKHSTLLPGLLVHSHGYLLKYAPGHPLAKGRSREYEHRVVFHAAHGDGPFNCHWCGCVVSWDDMHVDHVDDNKRNNTVANLVASCPPCNQARGQWKIVLTCRAKSGVTINGETLTLNEWSARTGLSRSSIAARMQRGWTPEAAVLTPRGKFGPKSTAIHAPV